MKAASMLFTWLLAALASSASAAEVQAQGSSSELVIALRGSLDGAPVEGSLFRGSFASLDPGWWKASTPVPSSAASKVVGNHTTKATAATSSATAVKEEDAPPTVALPISQLVDLLHSNEAGVQVLEKEMSTIHSRLINAETTNVEAAGNVSLASSGMYKLASKAQGEADELRELTLRSSMSGSSLDLVDNQLRGSKQKVHEAAKSAKQTAEIAAEDASPQALQSQEALNDKIWKLMDPTNKDSLDATEKQVSAMAKDTDKFQGELASEVRSVLITKMQSSVQGLREAVHKLGAAGSHVGDAE